MEHHVVTDYTNVNTQNEYLKVFVRARAPENSDKEAEDMFKVGPGNGGDSSNKKIMLKDPRQTHTGEHAFMFDKVFWTADGQEEVFADVAHRNIQHCFKGYNSCCFAYGQTGSGKTYSMFGEGGAQRGLIPRVVEEVFEIAEERSKTKEVAVLVSFLEMYCDNIRDLGQAYLDKTSRPGQAQKTSDLYLEAKANVGKKKAAYKRQNLEIREDAYGNVFVKDLSVIPVTTPEEVITIVQMGFRLRATHETKMNAVSSRSHTVFTMTVVQKDRSTGETITAMLHLVDLAGSERLTKSESEGQRLKEALSINSSLSALGKVVMALDPSAPGHVPYRDSKLTRLLQNSIGGNSYTTLLACMHPRNSDYDECLSTLQFANRCRNVRNQPRVNYVDQSAEDKEKRIHKLQTEVQTLRTAVDGLHRGAGARLKAVLTMLGIKGEMLPDGRFRTADGKVVGLGNDAALGMLAGQMQAQYGGYGGGMMGPGSPTGRAMPESRVKKLLDVEKRNVSLLKTKLKAKKEEIEKLKAQSRKDTTELRSFMASQRRSADERKEGLLEAQRRLQTQLVLQDENTEQIRNSLLDHNQRLLDTQHAILTSVPAALKVNSDTLRAAQLKADALRRRAEEQRVRDLKATEDSAALELEAVKQRLEAKVKEQARQIKEMLEEQHKYHSKRRQQVAEYRQEIEALAKYTAHCNTVLGNIELGKYNVRKLTGGRRTFALPATARPRNPLKALTSKGATLSKFTKTLNSTLLGSQAGDGGDAAPEVPATEGSMKQPSSALDAVRQARRGGSTAWQTDDEPASGSGTAPRVGSGQFSRPMSPVDVSGAADSGMQDTLQRAMFEDMDLDSELSGKSAEELAAMLKELRAFVKGGLYQRIEEHVLNDLAEQDTVLYMRKLEATVASLQKALKDQTVKHNQLRIAYTAQQRSMQKAKMRAPIATRPASARRGTPRHPR